MKFLLLILITITTLLSKEISYDTKSFQKMDIFNKRTNKVIFFVHGGAWRFGDKRSYLNNKLSLTKNSFVTVNYRLDGDIFNQVMDIYKRYLKTKEILGENREYILIGHSSGAHLLNVLSFKANLNDKLILLDTNYDFRTKEGILYKPFKKYSIEQKSELSPILYNKVIKNKNILVVTSEKNNEESYSFYNKFKKNNNIDFFESKLNHKELNKLLGSSKEKSQKYNQKIIKFINK